MKKLRVGITGDRLYENRYRIKEFIFNLRKQVPDTEIEIVSLGDTSGADKHVKKYSLELGYEYREMNPPHTNKNLYSVMSESFYGKPYLAKNVFARDKIFAGYIELCVIFDQNNPISRKCVNILKEIRKLKKKVVVIA